MINLGCTGSRHGMVPIQRHNVGTFFRELEREQTVPVLRQGCCTGVDEELTLFAFDYAFWIVGYPPLDRTHISQKSIDYSSEILAARGYKIRNVAIVDDCDRLLAVPNTMQPYPHSGTWFTINYARSIKRKITIFYPDGTVVIENEYNPIRS